tara:strand:- start:13858 stop:15948 length:2091 start_codon:yes stop_codon:yes gene_type:complete
MADLLFFDTETFSSVKIERGLDQYLTGMHPLIYTYALNDEPVEVWDVTKNPNIPQKLEAALRSPNVTKVAHNLPFDHAITRVGLGIDIPFEECFCTMSCAYAHSLPGSLDALGPVMGIDEDMRKLTVGKELIKLFCVPNPRTGEVANRETHPKEWATFIEYGLQDTAALREIYKRLPKHNYTGEHHDIWVLDMAINNRGFHIDQELCRQALIIRDEMKEYLEAEVTALTDGKVQRGTQAQKLLHYAIGEFGLEMFDMRKDTIKTMLEDKSLDPDARRLLELRRDSSLSSLTKYERALERVGPDGRMRHTLQFSGAGRTGRWAGRGFQPHNMPRPKSKADYVEETIIPSILDGTLRDKVTDVNQCCSDALRATIVAAPGCELFVGDWSNIEGVCNAWVAGDEKKLQRFRDNYFGDGPDCYVLLYSDSFGVPIDSVDDKQRQMGKGMELSMGYGGGVGAFIQTSASYGLDLEELGRVVPGLVSAGVYQKAENAWKRAFIRGEDHGVEADVYIACDALKQVWRKANPEIVQTWWDLERACKWAIDRPGSVHYVAKCKIWATPGWLIIELPSGRRLLYAQPQISHTVEYDEDTGDVKKRSSISYMAASAKQWRRIRTYSGKLLENVIQAIANDVLRASMLRADAAGYPQILHVHDEQVAEVPAGLFDFNDFLELMQEPLPWAPDLPLKAAGYVAQRYRKD